MHYTEVTHWPFKNFSPQELSCRCCGEFEPLYDHINMLQKARVFAGVPFRINCGHRCFLHNARVGGAPMSEHKKLAFDIDVSRVNRHTVLYACKKAGFTGFGYYQTFLHVDRGRKRFWYGDKLAEALWNG